MPSISSVLRRLKLFESCVSSAMSPGPSSRPVPSRSMVCRSRYYHIPGASKLVDDHDIVIIVTAGSLGDDDDHVHGTGDPMGAVPGVPHYGGPTGRTPGPATRSLGPDPARVVHPRGRSREDGRSRRIAEKG